MIPLHVVPGTAYADFFFIRKAKAGQKRKKNSNKKKNINIPCPPPPWVHGQFKEMQRYGEILCRYPLEGYGECEVPGQPMARRRHE